jgi:sugar phosphate isomerase/epimerase
MAGALAMSALPELARAKGALAWPLGVQLWSVNAELAKDFDATLHRLGEMGFVQVESAGLHGRTPEAFRKALETAGLKCESAHAPMEVLHARTADVIGMARDTGASWLVCASPAPSRALEPGLDWVAAMGKAMTLDGWKRNADQLNVVAEQAAKAGLGVAYHNHPMEFGIYDGVRAYDVLLERTDPKRVSMELDVAWATAGGLDPVALMKAHPDRFRLLHLKDVKVKPAPGTIGTDLSTTEVGRGVIDWKSVLATARAVGVRAAFVEQEAPYTRPVFDSLAICRDYLRAL